MKSEVNDNFNIRISLSLLTQKPIELEVSNKKLNLAYLKLINKLTDGSTYIYKNNKIKFTPGRLKGGTLEYRATDEIYNYIVGLLVFLPFCEKKTVISFTGITDKENCIDMIRIAHFKMLKIFKIPELELTVKKRGFYGENDAEGEVYFTCGIVTEIRSIEMIETEYLDKTSALLVSARVNSTYVHAMSNKVTELLCDYRPKIYTNMYNRNDSGPFPGYQCTLFCESKNGIFFVTKDGGKNKPELVVDDAVKDLWKSIGRGGNFDCRLNNLIFVFLALSSTNISRIVISKPDKQNKEILALLENDLNFKYEIRMKNDECLLISSGIGYINYNIRLDF